MVIDCLHGVAGQKHAHLAAKPSHGQGAHIEKAAARGLLDELRARGLVDEVARQSKFGHSYSALVLSPQGVSWLDDDDTSELWVAGPTRPSPPMSGPTLYAQLAATRARLATGAPTPPLSDATLRAIAGAVPWGPPELAQVKGLTAEAQLHFGPALTRSVRDHLRALGGPLPDGSHRPPWCLLSAATVEAVRAARPITQAELEAVPGVTVQIARSFGEELMSPFRSRFFRKVSGN